MIGDGGAVHGGTLAVKMATASTGDAGRVGSSTQVTNVATMRQVFI